MNKPDGAAMMGALRGVATNAAQAAVAARVQGTSGRVGQSERERVIYESEKGQN